MKNHYKVLSEKYNVIFENNSTVEDTKRLKELYKEFLTSETFAEFVETYRKIFTKEREVLKVMPAPPANIILDFIEDKPLLGGKVFKDSAANYLFDATTFLNSYFELKSQEGEAKFHAKNVNSRLRWAREEWEKWYERYKIWKDTQAELYKNNPGVNIDI